MESTRSALWMGAAALAGAAALVAFGFTRDRAPPAAQGCDGDNEVPFSDAEAEGLRETFERTALPYAAASFKSVRRDLAAYAKTWAEAREQTCATHTSLAQAENDARDAVLACLDQRRGTLQATVAALGQIDAAHVQHAWRVGASLPAIEDCGSLGPTAVAPDVAHAIAIATTWTALQAPDRVDEHARSIGVGESDPHRAEVLLLQGHAAALRGETAAAEAKLESAVWAATTIDRPVVVFESALLLADVVAQQAGRPADAQRWWKLASAANGRLAVSPRRQFRLLLTEAALLRLRGVPKPAVAVYEAALVLGERAVGAEHARIAEGLLGASLVAVAIGKRASATQMAERGLAIAKGALGPAHPQLTAMTSAFGAALAGTTADDLAAQWLTRAAELAAASPSATDVGGRWLDAGRAHTAAGATGPANAAYDRAWAWHTEHAPDDQAFARIEIARAAAARIGGNDAGAVGRYRAALEILGRVSPPVPEAVANVQLQLSTLLLESGEPQAARAEAAAAVATLTTALGADAVQLADAWLVLADAELRCDDPAAAIDLARAALRVLAAKRGAADPSVLLALTQLGSACLADHRNVEAVATFERAVSIGAASELSPGRLAALELSLATARWAAGDKATAIEAASSARARVAAGTADTELTLAQVDAWFARRSVTPGAGSPPPARK